MVAQESSHEEGVSSTLEVELEYEHLPTYIVIYTADAPLLVETSQPVTIYLTDDRDQRVQLQPTAVSSVMGGGLYQFIRFVNL